MNLSFKRWKVFLKSFLVMAIGVIIFSELPYFKNLTYQAEQWTLDIRYRNFNRATTPSQQIILVDLDEESLKKYADINGPWPWPHRAYKEIISFMGDGHPSMILFDTVLSEPPREGDDDQTLDQSSTEHKNVSHAALFLSQTRTEGRGPMRLPQNRSFPHPLEWTNSPRSWFTDNQFHSFILPNSQIWSQTSYIHSINANPDDDGISRRLPLMLHYDGQWISTLSLRGVLSQSLENPTKLNYKEGHLEIYESENILKHRIPLDEKGNLLVHYYANYNQIPQVRIEDIIESAKAKEIGDIENIKINSETFKDKIIIITTSLMGAADLKTTPIGAQYPKAILHATAISNILNNDYLQPAPPHSMLSLTLLLIFLSYSLIFFIENLFIRNVFPPLILFAISFLGVYLFRYESFHLPMALPLIAGGLSLLHGYTHIAIIESRQRKMIQGTLSKYLSPTLTKHFAESKINPTAEVGQWKEVSILFSEVRGFTALPESTSADFLIKILNEHLNDMTDVIFNHEGTLNKFMGDAIMAFWGAPLEDSQYAQKSVSAALQMIRAIEDFNNRNLKNNYPQLKIGIGIHTGKVIVGNIGSEKRIDYTILGDNVDLTSQLENLTKEYDIPLVISGSTYEIVKDYFIGRPLDAIPAKGKSTQSITLFQPLAERRPGPDMTKLETLCFMFTDAFKLYQQGQFTWALENFNKIKDKYPDDGPTLVYIKRCQSLIQTPPTTWNGVFAANNK